MLELPTLFPTVGHYVLALLILIGGQLIYATVGFGAGMFAITLLVLLLDDLPGVVMMMLLLTWTTEVMVLSREWRHARGKMLLWMVPPMALGTVVGTALLKSGDADKLKLLLGLVVALAGLWFLFQDYKNKTNDLVKAAMPARPMNNIRGIIALPVCFSSGFLGAMFGTGGPPVIIYLRSFNLPKGNFRSTILAFFITMSVSRVCAAYLGKGDALLTWKDFHAAAWMIPASIIGTILGAKVYSRLSERVFARIVSVMIFLLGLVLIGTYVFKDPNDPPLP